MSSTKYKIEETFTFNPDSGVGHRKHFTLPGHPYRCTLAFFDFATGTMLSCEFDEKTVSKNSGEVSRESVAIQPVF